MFYTSDTFLTIVRVNANYGFPKLNTSSSVGKVLNMIEKTRSYNNLPMFFHHRHYTDWSKFCENFNNNKNTPVSGEQTMMTVYSLVHCAI